MKQSQNDSYDVKAQSYRSDHNLVTFQSQELNNRKVIGTVENVDYVVVSKQRLDTRTDESKQIHYQELVQDNRRMREVLEQLQLDNERLKKFQSSDTESLYKELQATQDELNRLKISLQKQYGEQISILERERDEWRSKYELIYIEMSNQKEQLKQLNFYKNKCSMFESDAKKNFDKLNGVDNQIQFYQSKNQQLQSELEKYKNLYEELSARYRKLEQKQDSQTLIQKLMEDNEALIHEIKQWKIRYKALQESMDEFDKRSEYESQLALLRSQLKQKEDASLSQSQRAKNYDDELKRLQAQLEAQQAELSVFTKDKYDEMQNEIWKYQLQIEQMEKDIDIFVTQIKALQAENQDLTLQVANYTTELDGLRTTVNQNSQKYKSAEYLSSQVNDLQKELEVWKNRYLQTEIRLKEYDKLKQEYEALKLKQSGYSQQYTTTVQNVNLHSSNSAVQNSYEYIQLKSERDRLQIQIKELEQRLRESQQGQSKTLVQQTYTNSYSNQSNNADLAKISELTDLLRQKNLQIQTLESQLQIEKSNGNKSFELNEIVRQKNKQISELETQIVEERQTKQVSKIKDDFKFKDQRIRELESHIATLQLEIERLTNLRKEQESRIQSLLTKITEYESLLNIKNEQLRTSRKSTTPPQRLDPSQYSAGQQYVGSQYITQQIVTEDRNYSQQNLQGVDTYKSVKVVTDRGMTTAAEKKQIAQSYASVEKKSINPVVHQKLEETKVVTRNLYPSHDSQILERLDGSQPYVKPQIISVSSKNQIQLKKKKILFMNSAQLSPQDSFIKESLYEFSSKPRPVLVDQSDYEDIRSESSVRPRQDGQNIIEFIKNKKKLTDKIVTNKSVKSLKSGFSQVWKTGALRIIYLISRFLQIVKTSTDQYKFKLINKKIFNIINDQSVDYQYYYLNGLFHDKPSRLKKLGLQLSNHFSFNLDIKFKAIQPDNIYRIIFDAIVMILIVINLMYVPLKIGFSLKGQITSDKSQFVFEQLPSIAYIIEICLNFITAYYENGVINENYREIVKHYLRSDFIQDVIVVSPFFLQQLNIPYLEIVQLFRVWRVSKIVQSIEETTSIREKFAAPFDLAKLVFQVIFVSHICACLWNFIGDYQLSNSPTDHTNWVIRYEMENSSWESRYILCFYWSTITALTVGYGDITPGNDLERFVTTIIVLFCSIVFGYIISSIGAIFAQMSEKNTKFKNNMASIKSYIKKRKLNKQLQTKVQKYFEYLFTSQMFKTEECELMMDQLSDDIKREVKIDIYQRVIDNCSIIKDNFSKEVIQSLCLSMHTKKFAPGEQVLKQNQIVDQLLFVLSGDMMCYIQLEKKQMPLRIYNKGYIVGLKQYLTQTPINFSLKANKFLEVAYINYSDFFKAIKDSQLDLEKYQLIKDNLFYNPHYKAVKQVCQICSSNHSLQNCPFTFYQPNKLKITRPNNERQERFEQKRSIKQFGGFRQFRKHYQQIAIEFAFDSGILKEEDLVNLDHKSYGTPQVNSQISIHDKPNEDQQDRNNIYKQSLHLVPRTSQQGHEKIPSFKLIREQTKKKSIFAQIETAKQSHEDSNKKKFFTEGIFLTLPSLKIVDQIQREFLETIKFDLIPELDKQTELTLYYGSQNLSFLLSKQKEVQKKKKNARLVRKGHSNLMIPIVRQHGSFMKQSGSQLTYTKFNAEENRDGKLNKTQVMQSPKSMSQFNENPDSILS
ncbi:hypothetical protein pb186bvf_001966 [Paramecium bursaria]